MTRVSRRDFVKLGAAGAAAVPLVRYPSTVHGAVATAQEVVDRIRHSVGASGWPVGVDVVAQHDCRVASRLPTSTHHRSRNGH